jgi:hypothetical protein
MNMYYYRSNSPLALKINKILRDRRMESQDNNREKTKIYYITSSNWRGLRGRNESPPELMDAQFPWAPFRYLDSIIREVESEYGISYDDIKGSRRSPKMSYARHVVFYVAKEATSLSYPDIGRRMGGKDHTTILHGYHRIKKIVEAGGEEADRIIALKEKAKNRRAHSGYWGC